MRSTLLAFMLLAALGWVQASVALAQRIENLPDANGMDQVDIYLHTIDIDNLVYNNFGHTAIRVVDHRNHSDIVFNWGIFDFKDPLTFSWDFYRGKLIYKLGLIPYQAALRNYRWEERTVWEDKLLLTPVQKEKFLRRLQWNAQPENRDYAYQYFFDNCSTRPRNYLDEALGGELERQYGSLPSAMTFRDFVIDGYQSDPGMDVLLDFGMNSNIDRTATQWETMFHPLYLRSQLIEYSRKHFPIIGEGQLLVEHARPDIYPKLAYSLFLLIGGLPLIPLVFGLFLQQQREHPSKLLYRAFGTLSAAWFLFGGFWGFMMSFSWAVSGHADLHHNANQLLFWPVDLILFVLAMKIIVQGQPLTLKSIPRKLLKGYLLLHIVVSLLLPTLHILGFIEQNVSRVSVFLLPPYLALLLLLFRVGFRRRLPKA